MSEKAHWRQPDKKRAGVLLLIAASVLVVLGVFRHLEEIEALSGDEGTVTRTGIKAVGRALEAQEWRLYDLLHQNGRLAPVDEEIVVLGIDEASMDIQSTSEPEEIEQSRALQLMVGWPWSREVFSTGFSPPARRPW
jgi:hypothetical protein